MNHLLTFVEEGYDAALAAALTSLADDFEYDQILSLIEASKEMRNEH